MYVFASEGEGLLYKNKIICNSLCVGSCMCVCEVMHMHACACGGQRPMIVLLPYHCPLWACMYVCMYTSMYMCMYTCMYLLEMESDTEPG